MDGEIGGNRNEAQNINQSCCCADIFSGIVFLVALLY